MTPEEKAINLIQKFEGLVAHPFDGKGNIRLSDSVRSAALICCDEVLQSLLNNSTSTEPYNYWQSVKKNIKSL